ncbi:MAG: HK97 family phage prohead protease [Chromatiaceae bacterium]|nr:HK97 family phage prohead protease [Candidatus Thioaporhodococcus sediminis]
MTDRSKRIKKEYFERQLALDIDAATEDRVVPASLSSEEPYDRWFGTEVLVHEKGAVNLSRAKDGLPLLLNHDASTLPIGLVKNVRLDGDLLRGDLHFHDHTEAARSTWNLVKDRWIRGISIGYRIKRWVEEANSELVRVVDWELLEASVATVPADNTVGVNRTLEITTMPEINDGSSVISDGERAVVDLIRVHDKGKKAGQEEGAQLERQRIAEIYQAFQRRSVPQTSKFHALREEAIAGGWSLSRANAAILDLMSQDTAEPAVDHRSFDDRALPPATQVRASDSGVPRVELKRDGHDSLKEGIELALLTRAQLLTGQDIQKAKDHGLIGYSLTELGRMYLESQGRSLRGLDKMGIAGAMLTRFSPGHGSSDFTSILANVATKSMLKGWEEAPETWQVWTRIMSLPDFKQAKAPGLSNFSDLSEIPESAEYTYGTAKDVAENIQLKTYGKLFSISRQAIINDSESAFTTIPRKMGRAASRMIGDLVYLVLRTGTTATMDQDSTALFDASTHKNYVTSGAAPSVTTLDAGFTAMAIQTDPSGLSYLNISPRYLIVPKALESTAMTLVASQYDPAGTAGTLKPNPFQGRLQVVADARLDDTSWTTHAGKGWFLAADQNTWDTVVVGTLNGQTAPYLEEQNGFEVDGVAFKVRIDAVAEPMDFRTLYFNDGQ